MKATLLLAVLLPLAALADWNATFTEVTGTAFSPAFASGFASGGFAWGDYNNDGAQDLIVSGKHTGTCSFGLWKRGADQFTSVTGATSGLPTDIAATSIQWADYNADGWLDLLIYGANCVPTGYFKVFKNNKDGTFTAVASITTASSGTGYASFVDYNNDGKLDVVLIDSGAKAFWKNNGDGTFTDDSSNWNGGILATSAGSMNFIDYDRDGYPDLFLTGDIGSTTSSSVFWRNKGATMGFEDKTTAAFPGGILQPLLNSQVGVADFNRDSFLDLFVIGNNGGTKYTRLYVNNKNSTFSDVTSTITGVQTVNGGAVAWGDYNGDLYPDLYVQGTATNPTSYLLRNAQGNSFADVTTDSFPSNILPGLAGGAAAFGDFNGDGLADDLIVIGNDGSNDQIKLYSSSALPMRKPAKLSVNVAVTGSGTTRTVTVTSYLRASARQPVTSIEIVVSPNGGKLTKTIPSFNYKDEYKFTGSVTNIPVLSTLRKVWVRGVNKVGKGPWTIVQVTI